MSEDRKTEGKTGRLSRNLGERDIYHLDPGMGTHLADHRKHIGTVSRITHIASSEYQLPEIFFPQA